MEEIVYGNTTGEWCGTMDREALNRMNDMATAESARLEAERKADEFAKIFRTVGDADLLAMEFPPQRWFIEGVIPRPTPRNGENPRGLAIDVIGRAKAGKSWLALRLALMTAYGLDMDGRKTGDGFKVLYLNMELPENVMQYRIKTVCGQLGVLPGNRLHVVTAPPPGLIRGECPEDMDANLRDEVARRHGLFMDAVRSYDLVVVDPLYKVILPTEDENRSTDMARVVAWRDRLRANGTTVLTVHHEAKRQQGAKDREVSDAGSGSGVLGRDYDARIVIDSASDATDYRRVRYSLRCAKPRETDACRMAPTGGLVFNLTSGERAVWEALYSSGEKKEPTAPKTLDEKTAEIGSRFNFVEND